MGNRSLAWTFALVVLALWVGDALADTGGSMGGGDWGGGGGAGGGGGGGGWSSNDSSSSWSSSDSSSGWSSSSSSNSGGWSSSGSGLGAGAGFLIFLFAVVVMGVFMAVEIRSDGSSSFGGTAYTPPDSVDVSVLRIAIDGRARKYVQSELAQLARTANPSTGEGRVAMLRQVALMLRRARDAWVYGGAVNEPMRSIAEAKATFDRHVNDARARFREETIRNDQGAVTHRQASEYRPRGDEGAGLVLITIVVAARRELFTVERIGDGDELRRALESASALQAGNLVALEVVWQPSEDDDRLSSLELEAKYPRPDVIPIQNALVGKTFCTYCAGPFPAELVSCPHCGAPAPGRETARAA